MYSPIFYFVIVISHRGTLSMHRYIVQNLSLTFSMSSLFRHSFKTAIFSRFLKIDIAPSTFKKEVYNGEFETGFSVSLLEEAILLVWDYVSTTIK